MHCVPVCSKFGLFSGASRFTVGVHHLVSQLFLFHRIAALVVNTVQTPIFRVRLRVKFVRIINSEICRIGSRDFLHLCPQCDSRPSFTNVTVTHLSNARRIDPPPSKNFRDFDIAFYCELLNPQCWSGLVSSTALSILVFLLMSSARSLSIETDRSPSDVPFILSRT